MRSLFILFLAFILAASFSFAQDIDGINRTARPAPIQDNSFLIEEAYNQEDGVIQHISTFQRLTSSHSWVYTQTDEWPVRSLKHQLSVTLSGTYAGDFAGSGAGWGDTAF